jgi:hypothetical protein
MAIKIKKKGTDGKRRRRKSPEFEEPEDILGQGFNAATGTRIIVMGDAGELRGLYVARTNRPANAQGLFPLDFLAASYFMAIVGLLGNGPDAADPFPDENIRVEDPPDTCTHLLSCGPPEGARLWGATLNDGSHFMGIGPTYQTARGEAFSEGDLRVVGTALQEAILSVMPEEDREHAVAMLGDLGEKSNPPD